ncbi:DUF4112 domain-containing protein [Sphingobacterium sp. Mn56C]|uniref:DUF4112 domain-containing protein n=1 Tax=Sphingobacterium sp. Mn56C TaxID=3395261 RepID=UPI003BC84DAE
MLEKRQREFVWIQKVSNVMDSKFTIGGFSFGLDPLLNLIPFVGQVAAFGTSIVLVLVMIRNGASSKLAVKMLLNVMFDALIGAIPIFGQVFDFFYKANKKNVRLLQEHYFEGKHQGSAKGILISLFSVLILLCIGIIYVIAIFAQWTIQLFSNLF